MSENIKVMWPGWETVCLIGRGSFGAVYKIQRELFEEVEYAALKVISIPQNEGDIDELYSDGYDEESITNTFRSHLKSIVAEYSLMRKMSGCPNIVNCDDLRYVQHPDGIGWDIFIKMELLTPLTKALPAQIPEETVIKIAKDMCAALETCKKHVVVHRDIKPQNIFVSPNGDYKLGDFGIAKTVEKTMGGTKIGTYKYMAPEVYNNQPYGTAADIYSLGLVLYWMLNERRMPFLPLPPEKLKAGMEEEARSRRLSGEPLPPPAHGSPELKQIVLKACAFDPKDRYSSAAEMIRSLNALPAGKAVANRIEEKQTIDDTHTEPETAYEDSVEDSESHAMISSIVQEILSDHVSNEVETAEISNDQTTPTPQVLELQKKPKVKKKLFPVAILIGIAVLAIAVIVLITEVIVPTNKYNAAIELMDAGKYDEAIAAFEALRGYSDSEQRIDECNAFLLDRKYNEAVALLRAGKYSQAIAAFEALDGYKDSKSYITECKYQKAMALMDSGNYSEALSILEAIGRYKDSASKIIECNSGTKYKEAILLLNSGKYTEAIAAFEAMDGYKDSNTYITECKYQQAVALMDSGNYSEALPILEAIGRYKDSFSKTNECYIGIDYNKALTLMNSRKYTEAIAAFEALGGYKDSKKYISECRYKQAEILKRSEEYAEAIAMFEALGWYKDSADKAASIYNDYRLAMFKTAKVGDYVAFGTYEQDNITTNGDEYIEWLVLEKTGRRMLVISRYALDLKQYHTSDENVTWETCSLRKWLNTEFINAAFTAEEQARIPTVTVSADENPSFSTDPGNATMDKVFLLSYADADKYLNSAYATVCEPTAYTQSRNWSGAKGSCWWIRTPGAEANRAISIGREDVVYNYVAYPYGGYVDHYSWVRPVIWIEIS